MKVRLGALTVLLLLSLTAAEAGTVHGAVKNGTTGKPAAGVEVILIQLQGGMQPVATSKSDAQGQFTFDHASLGVQPMLLRAVYNGINFHQPVPPGKTNVEVDVFEPTKEANTISVGSRIVFFQPNGANLIVGEEYSIDNKSQPPRAYFRTDGNFEFSLPDNAQLQQVAASGPAGMPVVQAPIDKSKNHYAIAYAFRPGQSTVRYSYEIPYPGNAASLRVPMIYSASRLIVVAPPTMQVSGEGLQPGGQEQGMSIYGRENVAAGKAIAVSISGTAPPPAADNGQDAAPQGRDAQQAGEGGGISIQQVPGRLDDLKWPLLGVLAVGFALGAFLLSRKSVVSVPVGPQMQSESLASAGFTASSKSNTPPSAALAELDAAVGTSLDALKERIFRLELRRQAGTISEEEYGQERAKAEQVLRDLVRG